MDFDKGLGMINFLEMLANGVTVPDLGFPGDLLPLVSKEGEPFGGVDRHVVQTLCDLNFLLPEEGTTAEGAPKAEFRLTDKAHRLVRAQKARQSKSNSNKYFWIVVLNGDVFMDAGETPPNLTELIGTTWNDGDRVVITCHDPRYVRSPDLRLAVVTTLYEGLPRQEIDEIEKIAIGESHTYPDSKP